MLTAVLALLALQTSEAKTSVAKGWQLAGDTFPCVLANEGQILGQAFLLQVRPELTQPGWELNLVASTKLLPEVGPKQNPLSVSIGNATAPASGYTVATADGRRILRVVFPLELTAAVPPATSEITVNIGDTHIVVPTPVLSRAMAALANCHQNAIRALQFDPADAQAKTEPKLLNPGRWFSSKDLSPDIVQNGSGKVIVLLRVDPAGKVSDCKVVASPNPRLGELTCRISRQRVTATPALDAEGRLTTGTAFLPVSWHY